MLSVIGSIKKYKLNNFRTNTFFSCSLMVIKSGLTATRMKFMRQTAANNLSSEILHIHFCSCLCLTWCTVNICSLHFVCLYSIFLAYLEVTIWA